MTEFVIFVVFVLCAAGYLWYRRGRRAKRPPFGQVPYDPAEANWWRNIAELIRKYRKGQGNDDATP